MVKTMKMTIAIAGKGGTGKTTISGLLCRSLLKQGVKPFLAVDADPNSCLGERIGLQGNKTIGGLRQELRDAPDKVPAGIPKREWIERLVNESLIESVGFDMVVMGRTEGPGCYCSVNNMLRDILSQINKNYKAIVIDNEAGLEHLSRQTDGKVDVMLIACTPTLSGARTVQRIQELINQLGIKPGKTSLLLSQTNHEINPSIEGILRDTNLEIIGRIPSDPAILEYEVLGKSLLEVPASSPAASAIDELVAKLIEKR